MQAVEHNESRNGPGDKRSRHRAGRRFGRPGRRGFTLLELVIAVTILTTFLLPLMLIVTKSKVKAIRFTQQRELRDLAQRKLFDVMTYWVDETSGTFELEGRPEWEWIVEPPQMVGQGEQVLLEYMIRVSTPQKLDGESSSAFEGEGSTYEMSLWTFPDQRWYEEQQLAFERGEYSPLYDGPIDTGQFGGMLPPGGF